MMRYQRVSPDCLPFSNGKKSNLKTTTCKEEGENGKTVVPNNNNGLDANFDGGKGFRFRSPSRAQENHNHHHHNNNNGGVGGGSPNSPPLNENNNSNQSQRLEMSPSTTGGGDVLLQWGQKKRARLSRTEIRSMADDSSSSSSIQGRPLNKVHRRGSGLLMDKLSSLPPPPPPPLPLPSSNGRPLNLRSKETSGFIHGRNIEERSGVANGSPSRNNNSGSNTRAAAAVSRSTTAVKSSSPSSPDKIIDKKMTRRDEKQQPNGSLIVDSGPVLQSEQGTAGATTNHHHHHHHHTGSTTMVGGGEKVNVEVIEWPKIYLSLSRKEKEDDFLAMKGTKLPHRPKKRAKNVDRTLQYCFPGMWLSDLTKSRYEVREKKSVKKQKRRGLKGMESMESDSE
ncbi:hypothetical protein LWI29_004031 [Acer saccharum]|uniref:DUF1639 family protein n=1 Tax=Acer saccharum TaxID=4024 RepID=A0AA39VFB4_ACESA|nr:hypothetical protein LWI29_004031 [Acer saccharum]